MKLFSKLKNSTESQQMAKKVIAKRDRESLIGKYRKELTERNWLSYDDIYEYLLWNVKDILAIMPYDHTIRTYYYNNKFSECLYDILINNPDDFILSKDEIIGFNDACYNYLVAAENEMPKHQYDRVREMTLNISRIINEELYEDLAFIKSVPYDVIDDIIIARNSNLSEKINIMRVNLIVFYRCNPNFTEDEDLLDLYRTLFFNNIEELFLVSMFNVYDENTNYWYTHTMRDMDGWITNTVLLLLNELPLSTIKQTLIKYSEECLRKQCRHKDVRCSIRSLSADYEKVSFLAEELYNAGYYII